MLEYRQKQEALYEKVRAEFVRRYKRLADAVTAAYFGVPIEKWLWTSIADFATGRVEKAALPRVAEWVAEAEALAAERRFFHWPLEFPEVYFDRHGRALGEAGGFEAVVGDPPYIRQEELAPFKPYFAAEYPEVYNGTADYALFGLTPEEIALIEETTKYEYGAV